MRRRDFIAAALVASAQISKSKAITQAQRALLAGSRPPLPSRAANLIAAYRAYGGLISHTVADPSPATIIDQGNTAWQNSLGGTLPNYNAWFRTGFTTLPPLANAFEGSPFNDGNAFAQFPCATGGTTGGNITGGQSAVFWRTSVQSDAPLFGWGLLTGSGYRFLVNGKYQSLTPISVGTGGPTLVTLNFGSRVLRNIVVEGITSSALDSTYTTNSDILQKYPYTTIARMVIAGDSFTTGTGATNSADGFSQVLGDQLGIVDTWSSGVGGTGYVAQGTSPIIFNLTQRLGDVNNFGPWDAIIVANGLNDISLSAATIQANAATCFASFRANNPNTPIFVVGPWDENAPSAPVTGYVATKNAIQAGMAEISGCFFIDMQGVAYTQAVGLSPHPDTAGHATLATYIAGQIKKILGVF